MKRLCRGLIFGTGLCLMAIFAIPVCILVLPIVGIWTLTDWLLKQFP